MENSKRTLTTCRGREKRERATVEEDSDDIFEVVMDYNASVGAALKFKNFLRSDRVSDVRRQNESVQ